MSAARAPWRLPNEVHDPAKVLLDLANHAGGRRDCLADGAVRPAEPGVFGPAASDPTMSRTVDRLAADPVRVMRAIHRPRAGSGGGAGAGQ